MKCSHCNQKIDEKTRKVGKRMAFLGGKPYHSKCLKDKKNGNKSMSMAERQSKKELKKWLKKRQQKKKNLKKI